MLKTVHVTPGSYCVYSMIHPPEPTFLNQLSDGVDGEGSYEHRSANIACLLPVYAASQKYNTTQVATIP